MDDTGLLFAYLLDGRGGAKALTEAEITTWTPDQGKLWLHFDLTAPSFSNWLSTTLHLSPAVVESLRLEDPRPRTVQYPDGFMLFLRGVNLNPGQEPEDMVSLRIWVDENRIVTSRRRRLLSINDVQQKLQEKQGPQSSVALLTCLVGCLLDRIASVLDDLDEQMDGLEENIVARNNRDIRADISDVRRQSIQIRRYLAPSREALYQLSLYEQSFFSSLDIVQLREMTERVVRYVEDLDATRDRAAILHEELSNQLAEQLNARMYLLAMVAVIFLPLTFLTGLLGINVGGIPGASNEWGFFLVCLGLFFVALVMLLLFRRKRWL